MASCNSRKIAFPGVSGLKVEAEDVNWQRVNREVSYNNARKLPATENLGERVPVH